MKNSVWTHDAHCDNLYMRVLLGDGKLDFPSTDNKHFQLQVTFPRLKEGNVRSIFMNVGDMDLLMSSTLVDHIYTIANQRSDKVSICYNADDVYNTVESGKLALILSLEGQLLFLGQIDLLRNWHRLGVRVASLTHGEGTQGLSEFAKLILQKDKKIKGESAYALQVTESTDAFMTQSARNELYKKEKGLTEFGKLTLEEMDRLKIVCDLSHANDATFWEALELSSGKICCTHSNCASICCHSRNLTDSMMKALAEHGGVMGLCFYGEFIDQDSPSLERYVEHILHALTIMGPDHVGIGTDYDGVPPEAFMAISHPGHMNDLWLALDKAGVDEATMRKIAHENFLRLLSE